ncbi:hypothetical protein K0M31_004579 [Melipona bicolor]|uniref:Uncharacterized protein n=1 Tax=Melipona bicolor TaxID=60889 RepID=A0AA40KNI2_9HYME|nr:hypothetical protein K0M31_004579 [Melipona bicolor]
MHSGVQVYEARDIATAGVGAEQEAAMKKQRAVGDISSPVSPIGTHGKIVCYRVYRRGIYMR